MDYNILDGIYKDIGKKIKQFAKASFIVEAIGAIITGLTFLFDWGIEDAWWSLFIIIFGPVVAWVFSWFIYGFGELIDTNCESAKNTQLLYYKKYSITIDDIKKQSSNFTSTTENAKTAKDTPPQKDGNTKVKLETHKENKPAEPPLKIICPKCNEDLSFMGFKKGNSAQCPFCSFEFAVE